MRKITGTEPTVATGGDAMLQGDRSGERAGSGRRLPPGRVFAAALALCALAGCAGGEREGASRATADDEPAAARIVTTGRSMKNGDAAPGPARVAENKAEALEAKAADGDGGAPASPREAITPREAQAVDPAGREALDDAITCLARSIYWESKGDGIASMEAVASVVMNRVGRADFPDTVCGVVKQGRETGACQFSWWCDGRPDTVQEPERYAVAKEVARKALNRQLADRTGGATYFHHVRVTPSWSKTFTRTAHIGAHLYYRPAETASR